MEPLTRALLNGCRISLSRFGTAEAGTILKRSELGLIRVERAVRCPRGLNNIAVAESRRSNARHKQLIQTSDLHLNLLREVGLRLPNRWFGWTGSTMSGSRTLDLIVCLNFPARLSQQRSPALVTCRATRRGLAPSPKERCQSLRRPQPATRTGFQVFQGNGMLELRFAPRGRINELIPTPSRTDK